MTNTDKINIPPFYTMEMMKYAAELEQSGTEVYHLEVGQSYVPTPHAVVEEATKTLQNTPINYCSALGLYELRAEIAMHYERKHGIQVSPNRIIITPGSSLGLYITLLMSFRKHSKIAVFSPSYPCYRNVIRLLGHELIEIVTKRENNYLMTPDELEPYKNIDGIIIASPNNPTGSVYDSKTYQALINFCEQHGIQIISDEIYHGISYETVAETALKFSNQAIVVNGFSKYFAMTGWRIGWAVIDENDIERYESLLQNVILCSSMLTQKSAVKAFAAYQELDAHVKNYREKRDILFNELLSAGLIHISKPQGGFYIYLEFDHSEFDSMELCKRILYEEKVATAPGIDFVSNQNKCSIRLSFCQDTHVIESAAKRIKRFFKNNHKTLFNNHAKTYIE